MSARTVRFVVPDGVDDPLRVSGGNVYDARVRDGLVSLGWLVHTVETAPDAAAPALEAARDGELVLVDGLVAGRSSAAVEAEAERLRVVVVAHMLSEAFSDADPHVVAVEARERVEEDVLPLVRGDDAEAQDRAAAGRAAGGGGGIRSGRRD